MVLTRDAGDSRTSAPAVARGCRFLSLFGEVFFRVPRECDLWALSTAQTPAAVDNSNRKLTSLLTNW